MTNTPSRIPSILERHSEEILEHWLRTQAPLATSRSSMTTEEQLRSEGRQFLATLRDGVAAGADPERLDDDRWIPLIKLLQHVARKRLQEGFPMRETAAFVSEFKEPLFDRLSEEIESPEELTDEMTRTSKILDLLALRIAEVYLDHRGRIIERQREELLELSTPVVRIWEGILALPLIGTLDSARTQVIMENLLDSIVQYSADIAILDITGVPTVDTQVAQNLMKTVAAARLMGTRCIVSGIRPQIAQTIVQLGLSLENIETRSSFSDAIALAFRSKGWTVRQSEPRP